MKLFGILSVVGLAHAGCYSDPELRRQRQAESEAIRAAHPNSMADLNAIKQSAESLPSNYNWCQLPDGRSLCVPSWNQHIPVYCGSCWLHGTLTHLMDRLYIQQGGKYPPVMLARQTILNCGPFHNMSNGCNGGSSLDVYQFMEMFGLPDEGCQVYEAKDYTKYGKHATSCPADGYCINCMNHGTPPRKECWPVHRPIKYSVSDYGPVPQGAAAMMVEIYNNGPIACGMVSYDDFNFNYRGGVWKKSPNDTDIDHIVEIVGWGESEEDGPYWVVRNSWGTYWGEMGFFRAPRGNNALQLEVACMYATPTWEDEKLVRNGKLVGTMYGLVPTEDHPQQKQKEL
eukprot:comp22649_c1_seq1/m.34908 comp22649_c1_seq1/g.34908  ORF comp22649_c1_seq1/g.34908 comp22649_c1_seq1/m.34908 type:complete len:342 (-) comp22649_c1_seq1:499-1524(-)